MIDRNYLPYKSAREYQDRGMAKWMGFFLSEHQSALGESQVQVDNRSALSLGQRFMLLTQAYVHQIEIRVTYLVDRQYCYSQGKVIEMNDQSVLCRGIDHDDRIIIEDILAIEWESDFYEKFT